MEEVFSPVSKVPSWVPMDAKIIGSYVIGRKLGEGTFGSVKLGTHLVTKQKVTKNSLL
jgi:hypothetical protein